MSVNSCKKMQEWTRRDSLNVTLMFALNLILCMALFILSAYLNHNGSMTEFLDFFKHYEKILQFAIFLFMICGVIGLFLFFDDRDFLKSPLNVELLFFTIQITLIISYVLEKYVSVYLIPFALPSLMMMFLFDKRKIPGVWGYAAPTL